MLFNKLSQLQYLLEHFGEKTQKTAPRFSNIIKGCAEKTQKTFKCSTNINIGSIDEIVKYLGKLVVNGVYFKYFLRKIIKKCCAYEKINSEIIYIIKQTIKN